jgi:uncharacterized protein YprB with RNaseH-like and TPR domain
MNILKETQYLRFVEFEKKEKTKVIAVMNIHHEEIIGMIKWFARWRQYCFFPTNETVWNINCLNDVNSVITMLADERKKKKVVAFETETNGLSPKNSKVTTYVSGMDASKLKEKIFPTEKDFYFKNKKL